MPFCTSSSSSSSAAAAAAHSETTGNSTAKPRKRNTLVNFSMSDSEFDSDSDSESKPQNRVDKSNLPPPYDPFSKKPVIEEPEDPTNLQEVFHRMRGDGMMDSAAKMFDGLSKDGLTHEALELFSQIKDKGQMPEVVAHTAVMEAYVNAGQAKQGLKVFMQMLGSGVLPNAYTYSVLIRGLVASGDVKLAKEAKKHALEMVEKRGIKPNAGVCAGVYEGLANVGLAEEGKELLEILKSKGVVPEEGMVREAVKNKRAHLNTIMSILYGG
ncbi:OLC1v1038762C1 [Oldenlandia corymbosa var. corymbosa]|uniref:OLC1v1038762C1 n=1 Tax=Oldenlandia corymbosa var. corymbosa TaxID=529605 RepID=A0AAV1D3L1_OLDCO|nr:OLC1v1038762C1 [Oldenlandia corymbosa var. corymbosa]